MSADSFDPPSDFEQAGSGGGGGGSSVWMWLGIGCGVVLLLVAVGLGLGFYQGYACCKEQMRLQQAASETAKQFAVHVRNRKYDQAMALTSESFKQTTGREAFLQNVSQYREGIEKSVPELVGLQRASRGSGAANQRWNAEVAFRPHAGDTYVVMGVELEKTGSGEDIDFEIDRVSFEREERNIATEPPARVVRRFNALLREDSASQARGLVVDSFDASSSEAFSSFVSDHATALKSDDISFDSIQYGPDNRAVVRAVHVTESGESHRVSYTLVSQPPSWRISGVSFDEDGGSAEAATSDGDTGTDRDANGEAEDVGGDTTEGGP